jgi:branched-chain amino acid transport system permease protein
VPNTDVPILADEAPRDRPSDARIETDHPRPSARRWPDVVRRRSHPLVGWVAGTAVLLLPLWLLDNNDLFKVGAILIFFVSAVGLHLLVNWTGELSLAHGSVLGLAALTVARVSVDHHVPALLIIPIGILVGAAAGLTLAAVAFRARGFYVAIVTLAGAVVIDRYFFTKTWLVGSGNITLNALNIGNWDLETPKQLYPLLVVAVLLAVYAFRRLSRSRFGRGMLMVRRHPTAALAQGVNVRATRALAYIVSGIFAGLAGGLSAMWIQSVAPSTYNQDTNLNFLTAVVVAGPGSLFAVAEVSVMLEGIRLFISDNGPFITYIGPVGLVFTLVKFPGGVASANEQTKRQVLALVRRLRGGQRKAAEPSAGDSHPAGGSSASTVAG